MGAVNFHDTVNLISKLTPARAWNAAAVLSSYYLSRLTGRPIQWGSPVSLSFEPTTSCNLRCPECPSGLRAFSRATGMLQPEFFEHTIDQLSKRLLYLIFYFQGEPYLNRDFLKMVRYASSRNIYTATSTNAHYLTEETARETVESGLDRLIISIDGTTQETYSQYRKGGQLSKVLEGTERIVRWKKQLGSKTPYIFFQFLVVRHNEHQIPEIWQLAKSAGVDGVKLKTAQVYDYENDPNQLIPVNDRYSRYKKDATGKWKPKNKLANHCWRLWHAAVITWNGDVVPCCFDKDAKEKMGNLGSSDFRSIWNNPDYIGFRTRLMKGRKNIDICANCSEGTKVWT